MCLRHFQVSNKSGGVFSIFFSSEYDRSHWMEQLKIIKQNFPQNCPQLKSISIQDLQPSVNSCQERLKRSRQPFLTDSERRESLWNGDLNLVLKVISGLPNPSNIFVVVEVDTYGHFHGKVKTREIQDSEEPTWNDAFVMELECSKYIRFLVYEKTKAGEKLVRGKSTLNLSCSWLGSSYSKQRISINDMKLTFQAKFVALDETIRRVPAVSSNRLFKASLRETTEKEKCAVPFIITSLVKEVEQRGITEVGIYRVNGSAIEMSRLKRVYESNPYEAEQLIKECDVHAVAGILKQYLRDLPECIFTLEAYKKLNEAYTIEDEEN